MENNVILSKTKTISKFSELMNVFIASDFHIMQHLIRTYGTTSTILHVCIDFVFSLSFNSLLLDAWFSQIILTWSFPYLEMSVVFRRYSINANTTIDIMYISSVVEHSTADWEVPSWTTERVPCYYCHYLYGTHKDLSGPSIQTKFDLFVHILTAWVSWGGGRRGQKRLCHIYHVRQNYVQVQKGSGVW